jgi:amylosucrase
MIPMNIQSALTMVGKFNRLVDAASLDHHARELLKLRFRRSADDLFGPFDELYATHPEYEAVREELLAALVDAQQQRSPELRLLDLKRDLEPDWFQRPEMVGYVFYIDRFAGTMKGVLEKLDYLEELGATYIHFMPCLKPREGDSDGGYSVMDYRAINPPLSASAA